MKYSPQEVIQYVAEEDVKFIRLAFCDVFGKPKNISIMTGELARAFEYGIAIDASAIEGFGDETHADLLLKPDPDTLSVLPWRPEHGRVVRMYCSIYHPDGTLFEHDTRSILKKTIAATQNKGISFSFGAEMEFYLFKLDENSQPTSIPYDLAGYMDMSPDDKGENVRREICLTLEQMGIRPESSHHEEGPGQNEIDFRYADALTSADNAMTFRSVVQAVALRNGLYADFSPKPLKDKAGNGFHINMSAKSGDRDLLPSMIAGILSNVYDLTLFLNPSKKSYERLGNNKAPRYISWSHENRSQLVRIPAAIGEYRRAELRSPDPYTNPYLAFALLIEAGLKGIEGNLSLPSPANINLFSASKEVLANFKKLPSSIDEAIEAAKSSSFIASVLPKSLIEVFCNKN